TMAPTLTNGMVAAWTVIDRNDGSNNRFDFATYNAGTGYGVATYTKVGSGGSGGIRLATASDIVEQTGNATLSANASAYALKVD
ncbi:hypothetical protein, partial [Escherichia coli]|uniref:hypothetical protein n=1 Tax=Escherichia coli TaxID=562 RepID=UPI0013CF8D1D